MLGKQKKTSPSISLCEISLFQLPHYTGLHVDSNSSFPRPEAAVSPSLPCSLMPQSTVFWVEFRHNQPYHCFVHFYLLYCFNNT